MNKIIKINEFIYFLLLFQFMYFTLIYIYKKCSMHFYFLFKKDI